MCPTALDKQLTTASTGRPRHRFNDQLKTANSRGKTIRILVSGTFSILVAIVASGCGGASADTASTKTGTRIQQAPAITSILQCEMSAIAEPLAHAPNALKKASEVYRAIDSNGDVVTALESAYTKKLSTFTYDEQAEGLIILSGLDYCDGVNEKVKENVPTATAILLSGRPAGNNVATPSPRPPSTASSSPAPPSPPPPSPPPPTPPAPSPPTQKTTTQNTRAQNAATQATGTTGQSSSTQTFNNNQNNTDQTNDQTDNHGRSRHPRTSNTPPPGSTSTLTGICTWLKSWKTGLPSCTVTIPSNNPVQTATGGN